MDVHFHGEVNADRSQIGSGTVINNMAIGADNAQVAELLGAIRALTDQIATLGLDSDTVADARHELTQAAATATDGRGSATQRRLITVRTLLESVTGAAGAVTAIDGALRACRQIFGL